MGRMGTMGCCCVVGEDAPCRCKAVDRCQAKLEGAGCRRAGDVGAASEVCGGAGRLCLTH
jgi:hypothetical protein